MIERAYLENEVFDCLKAWKIFHPRTFWQMVDAVANLIEAKQPSIGETTTTSIVSWQFKQIDITQ